jgi:TrmH family RNA methyltransferase
VSYDITSPTNERIKWLVRLRDRKHRDAESVFLVEGERLYGRALAAGLSPAVTFTKGEIEARGDVVTVAPDVLDKASYRNRSQGIIGVFAQFETGLSDLQLPQNPLILVVEGIEKPGNLGAMLRTASAAGVDAVVSIGDSVDLFNPNALRASTGAVFSVPVVVSDWDHVGIWLSEQGITAVATVPGGGLPQWETDLSGPTAVLVGAEDEGLSDRAVTVATRTISIPQHEGTTDSLNASVAAAIVLFEAVRQRSD